MAVVNRGVVGVTNNVDAPAIGKGIARLLGAVTGIAVLGALVREAGTYLPPHRIWMWWIPVWVSVGVFAIAVALSARFWIWDHTWRDKYLQTLLQTQQVALNKSAGFTVIGYLSPKDGKMLSKNSKEPANIVQVGEVFKEDGFRFQTVKITEPTAKETELAYAVLFERMAWEKDSITHFAGSKDAAPVFLKDGLEAAKISESVSRAARVMCFGFASSERHSSQAENEKLSDDRAINLCEALIALDYVSVRRGQEAIAAGFGEALTAKDAVTDPSSERLAIIVGIKQSPRKPTPQAVLNAVRLATKDADIGGIDLQNYSRFSKTISGFRVGVADGKYSGYRDKEKWNKPGASFFSEVDPIKALDDGQNGTR